MKLLSVPLRCSPVLLLEFKRTAMATPSPNNSTTPSSNNAGSAAHLHHQSQSQHITTMSSMQGKCGHEWKCPPLDGSSRFAAVKVNVSSASRERLHPGPKKYSQGNEPGFT